MCEFLRQQLMKLDNSSAKGIIEPFCGGAGASLNLLADNDVEFVCLNDADIRIYSAWYAILNEAERFIDTVNNIDLNMDEWYKQSDIATSRSNSEYSFELGFATFFMNRTTRSGIIERAGPIGGYDQTGAWKIDARFNREKISKQIKWLSENKKRIFLSNLDALNFIYKVYRKFSLANSIAFIDPPYVQAGSRLYYNGMNESKHIALADFLLLGNIPNWVLTYDDDPLIRNLYRDAVIRKMDVKYSLQKKRKESELLIVPKTS